MAAAVAWQCLSSQAIANRWSFLLEGFSDKDKEAIDRELRVIRDQLLRRQGDEAVLVLPGVVLDSQAQRR